MSTRPIMSGFGRAYRGMLPLVAVVALGIALVACQGTAPGATNPVAGALPGDPGDPGDAATTGPSPTPNQAPTARISLPGVPVDHRGFPYASAYSEIKVDARGSTDPEGKPLKFEWNLDGDTTWEIPGEKALDGYTRSWLYHRLGRGYQGLAVRVTDPGGLSSVAVVYICAPCQTR